MVSCPRCATAQIPNTLFCNTCGQEIERQTGEWSFTGQEELVLLRCLLLDERRSFMLPDQHEFLLGRSDRRTNVLPDLDVARLNGQNKGVSRRHARLTRRGRDLYLEDLGSMNGTFVNERRLSPRRKVSIHPGDTIRLGLLRLTFRFEREKRG